MLAVRTENGLNMVQKLRDAHSAIRCICGRAKQRRKPFCPKCQGATPKDLRMGLNSPEPLTAAQTYRDCVEWLEENGWLGKGAAISLFPGGRSVVLSSETED